MSERVKITAIVSLSVVMCLGLFMDYQTEKLRLRPDSWTEIGQHETFEPVINISNARCQFYDRQLGEVVDEPTDLDFDPDKNTRMYVVLCEGESRPMMTPFLDLSDGVPLRSLILAPAFE